MSVTHPILLPKFKTLLCNPQTTFIKVSGELWQAKVYRESLQQLLQVFENRAHCLITNGPEESGLTGVLNEKLMPLQVL